MLNITILMLSEAYVFRLLKEYFDTEGLANIQLSSYNHLITSTLQGIINEEPEIVINITKTLKYTVYFGTVNLDNPYIIEADRSTHPITPTEARTRDLTYDGPVCVDIVTELTESDVVIERQTYNKVSIARIPIMLRSVKCNLYGKSETDIIKAGECSRDPGGYFIIKGKERVLITQERVNYNTVFVFKQNMYAPTTPSSLKRISVQKLSSIAFQTTFGIVCPNRSELLAKIDRF